MSTFFDRFGILMGQLVAEYCSTYAWIAPLPHLATLLLLYLIFRQGNRTRKALTIYFILDYIWLVIFVGGWFTFQLYQKLGFMAVVTYGGTLPLLLLILAEWVQELRHPRLDLDFTRVNTWRFLLAIPILLWGFWYPPYIWGIGLSFDPKELLLGAYGLMGCPSTMVPLSLLFLKYPAGNRLLFYALTVFAVIIGFFMTLLRYWPDTPLLFMGLASLGLIIQTRLKGRGKVSAKQSFGQQAV